MNKKRNWGGKRTPGPGKRMGPEPFPEEERRVMATARYAPNTLILAKKIAGKQGLLGWSRAIDLAIEKLAIEIGIE